MKIYPQNKEQTRGVGPTFSIILFYVYKKITTSMMVLYKVLKHYLFTNIIILFRDMI